MLYSGRYGDLLYSATISKNICFSFEPNIRIFANSSTLNKINFDIQKKLLRQTIKNVNTTHTTNSKGY